MRNGDLNQIADDIIDTLSLEERVRIANMDEADVGVLQEGLGRYLSSMIGDDPGKARELMLGLCERLRKTRRLRAI